MNSPRAMAWRFRTSSSWRTADMPVPAPKDRPILMKRRNSTPRLTEGSRAGTRCSLPAGAHNRRSGSEVQLEDQLLAVFVVPLCAGLGKAERSHDGERRNVGGADTGDEVADR